MHKCWIISAKNTDIEQSTGTDNYWVWRWGDHELICTPAKLVSYVLTRWFWVHCIPPLYISVSICSCCLCWPVSCSQVLLCRAVLKTEENSRILIFSYFLWANVRSVNWAFLDLLRILIDMRTTWCWTWSLEMIIRHIHDFYICNIVDWLRHLVISSV